MNRITPIAMLALFALPLAATAAPKADDLPEPLRAYLPFVERCVQWHSRNRGLEWKTIYVEKFDQGHAHWRKASRYAKVKTQNGKKELLITPARGSTAFVPIGPKIKGQFAIEIAGRAVGNRAVPLGIMLGSNRGDGPGFQFATLRNGNHLLWNDVDATDTRPFGARALGNQPKLVINQTYRVRLEVLQDQQAGFVDGRLFGKVKPTDRYDWDLLRQPHAMTVVEPIVVSSFRIEQFVPKQNPQQHDSDEDTWSKLFGDQTREQIEAQAAELVQMLDHDRWPVREAAAGLIRDVGDFARPALQQAITSGSPELKWRAEQLLRAIPTSPTTDDNQPAPTD